MRMRNCPPRYTIRGFFGTTAIDAASPPELFAVLLNTASVSPAKSLPSGLKSYDPVKDGAPTLIRLSSLYGVPELVGSMPSRCGDTNIDSCTLVQLSPKSLLTYSPLIACV